MRQTPLLFRLSLLGGLVALGLVARRGLHPRRARRPVPPSAAGDHAHGHEVRLPKARFPARGPDRTVPDYGPLPDFGLVESDGSRLDLARLRGRAWVASFLFTSCGGTCPDTARRARVLQAALPEDALLVSFSVDPARDTPEKLTTYGKGFGRRPGRWLLATGDPAEIQRLAARGFRLGEEGAIFHSSKLALVDPGGNLRGFYESADDDAMVRLVRDANLVLAARAG